MQQIIPVGWSKERVQEYFIWAKKVTDGARGINQKLEEQLDEIYSKGTLGLVPKLLFFPLTLHKTLFSSFLFHILLWKQREYTQYKSIHH